MGIDYFSSHLRACVLTLVAVFAGTAAQKATAAAYTMPGTAYFKTIDTNSGLPDNSINAIAEDKLGFIWIGTWNGLVRYDGVPQATLPRMRSR